MARKTAIDKLADDIAGIFEEYEDEVRENVAEITIAMAKKGAKALKRESKAQFKDGSGEYAKGWKVESTDKKHRQVSFSAVIYNEHAGLPHLLENGHVIRNGTGRTYGTLSGRKHIEPVEKELVDAFEKEVLDRL